MNRLAEVFLVFLRLGLTSFGGPVAHLGYFRKEFVERRQWLSEPAYASTVALCQFLPGPASSQVGMALGLMRAGVPGAVAAFLGFTAPSAVLMMAFACFFARAGDISHAPWIHGLKLAAVGVVAQAVWRMARTLTPDGPRILFAVGAAIIALLAPPQWSQIAAIALAGAAGAILLQAGDLAAVMPPFPIPRRVSIACLAAFFILLIALPLLAPFSHGIAVADAFYRTGALVFGGGHVVLPLLQHAVVDPGWAGRSPFLAGYGAAQAMPGPLFSFAAFLGAVLKTPPNGIAGALLALAAIYLPSFLLVLGAAPLWSAVQHVRAIAAAVRGINAAVVGLLAAALYTPVWTSAVFDVGDVAVVAAVFLLLWRGVPSWAAVALGVLYTTLTAGG